MKITRTSMLSGISRTMDIPCTPEQYEAWETGTYIQDAMPQATPDEREFVLTGVTKAEWDEAFGDDDRIEFGEGA